jgi:hypothetical protein
MTAPETVALDQSLARAGEDVIVRRTIAASPVDVACRAKVSGISPQAVAGLIAVTDLAVIISPTQILAAGWPAGAVVTPGETDPRIPRINDFVVVKGKQRQVKFSDPIFVGNEWVRCNMIVAG